MHQRPLADESIARYQPGEMTSGAQEQSRQERVEISADQLFAPILRRWWLVLGCALLALVTGYVYLLKTPKQYMASTAIYLDQDTPAILDSPMTVPHTDNYLSMQCELIKSTAVLELALGQPGMQHIAATMGPGAIGYIKGGLSILWDRDDDVLDVQFQSTVREDCAVVANAVVEGYRAYKERELQFTGDEVLNQLQNEKAKADAELAAKIKTTQDFIAANLALSMQDDMRGVTAHQLDSISDEMTRCDTDVERTELELSEAQQVANDPAAMRKFVKDMQSAGEIKADPQIDAAESELADLQSQLSAARTRFGEKSVVVKDLQDRIASINIDALTSASASRLYADYVDGLVLTLKMEKDQQNRLGEDYAVKKDLMAQLEARVADFRRRKEELEEDQQRAEARSAAADDRVKQVQVTQGVDQTHVKVMELAEKPGGPVAPVPAKILGLALGMGLMLGCGFAMLYDRTDQRFRSLQEMISTLGIPLLGSLLHIPGEQTPASRGQEVFLNPMSDAAEAYRALRTAIYFGVREERLKTIVVTSPSTGDGKSSTVANLAICMAHAGRRTLIVDADLRRPIQHEIFSLPQHAGLSSVLSGDATLEDSIFPTHINGLDLLPSGALPSRPSESLNSERFATILATLAQHYDYVLLDSPPVLAVSDARILSAMSDATLLVLRWNSSTRHASLSARESLWSVGAKILGFVVNDITKATSGYYESYYPPRTPGLGGRTNGNGGLRLEKNGNGKGYENGKSIGAREGFADKRDPLLPGPGVRA